MLTVVRAALVPVALLSVMGDVRPCEATAGTSPSSSAMVEIDDKTVAESSSPAAPAAHHERLAAPIRERLGSGELYVPRGLAADAGAYDLVVHFHGVPLRTEKALDVAHLGAVLYTVNLGNGSGAYEAPFAAEGALDATLARVERALAATFAVKSPHLRRLALSAWSAGYGAIAAVLSHPGDAARVDAVLLADGMHTGFVHGHEVDPVRMAPFSRFARAAARGDRLMAVTHSSIVPGRHAYASTTETARFLLVELGVDDVATRKVGPRGMLQLDEADRGGLHVRGYAGTDKAAHCDHLIAIGETLFPYLAERWGDRSATR